jgi:hypothetical protein
MEVYRKLKCVRRAATGIDEIPHWVYLEFAEILAEAVTDIFNTSLNQAICPSVFKFAIITPITKVSKPSVTDYRPISLLPTLAKIMERLLIEKFLFQSLRGKMDTNQFAFSPGPGKGCTCALTLVQHHILSFLDNKSGAVRVLMVDLTKAFDRATKSVVVRALEKFNVSSTIIYWICNYLSDRYQSVRTNGIVSGWKKVKSGVPQGSVLGPILFAAIVDELKPVSTHSVLIKYADDLTILHRIRNVVDDHLQDEWNNIKQWCASVQLEPNPRKTKVLDIVTSKSMAALKPITHEDTPIENVTSAKLLGIIISDDMKWNIQVNAACQQASRRIFSLVQLRGLGAPSRTLQNYYISMIRSILLYAFPAWCNLTIDLKNKLTAVEHRTKRMITNCTLPPLFTAADTMAQNLMKNIAKQHGHPLGIIPKWENRRGKDVLTSHFASTTRYKNAFHRYANDI